MYDDVPGGDAPGVDTWSLTFVTSSRTLVSHHAHWCHIIIHAHTQAAMHQVVKRDRSAFSALLAALYGILIIGSG